MSHYKYNLHNCYYPICLNVAPYFFIKTQALHAVPEGVENHIQTNQLVEDEEEDEDEEGG